LQQIANYLTAQFAGKEISQVRSDLLAELRSTRETMDRLMREAVDMAERLFAAPRDEDSVLFQGQTNLMDFEELSNVGKLRQLFEAFNRKRDMLQLLDHCLNAQGVQIFIGEESGYEILDDCSLITSTYSVGDKVLGVLGVIGPTRMPYDRVIPVVDLTAKLLGAALNSR
jgi:heat-inducible transcriptional repressor